MLVAGEIEPASRRYARIELFPVTVDAEGQLYFTADLEVVVGDRQIASHELLDPETVLYEHNSTRRATSTLADSPEYVIVTGETLVPAFEALARYKRETGYRTEIALMEDIRATYGGRDDAEKLREYLIAFHALGGRYVLLGGDETIVPIRYAYHYRADELPPLTELQVCDLYFADLTGQWDVDNDGIWGERYDDQADLYGELLVGRLPLRDTAEVRRYVDKLIAYETRPGDGDPSYLTGSFFFSSDQMRDYGPGGQHARIASAFPTRFAIDTLMGVEQASGDDPAPTNLSPTELTDPLSNGYGIVNIVAHGRSDGFVVKSSNYNEWPKAYLLTGETSGEHAGLDSINDRGRPSFWYSLACDNGGYDLSTYYGYTAPSLCRSLLGKEAGGAVGFIAQSRWGWVGTSHLLHKAFFDLLFAYPDRPASEAYAGVKDAYYYYRDLVLGQNYYGDPTVVVYADIPEPLELSLKLDGAALKASVTQNGVPVAGCRVILADTDHALAEFVTDGSGEIVLPEPLDPETEYVISALSSGCSITQTRFRPSLAVDVGDDTDGLPVAYHLSQNYPNPFNPSTSIAFSLPKRTQVSLEVYNVMGQLVGTPADGEYPAGEHVVEWDGRDSEGNPVATGVYLYRLTTSDFVQTRKMVLVK